MYKTGTNPRDHFTDKTNTWSCDLTKADLRAEDFKFSHKYMLLSHCDFIIITNLIFLFKNGEITTAGWKQGWQMGSFLKKQQKA